MRRFGRHTEPAPIAADPSPQCGERPIPVPMACDLSHPAWTRPCYRAMRKSGMPKRGQDHPPLSHRDGVWMASFSEDGPVWSPPARRNRPGLGCVQWPPAHATPQAQVQVMQPSQPRGWIAPPRRIKPPGCGMRKPAKPSRPRSNMTRRSGSPLYRARPGPADVQLAALQAVAMGIQLRPKAGGRFGGAGSIALRHTSIDQRAVPLGKSDLEQLWNRLRAVYPADFSVKREDVLNWHQRELEQRESAKEWERRCFKSRGSGN